MFTDDEIFVVKNCLEYRLEELQERLDNFDGFGLGVKESYESELKQINEILDNIAKGESTMETTRINHKGQTEHFCETCKRWRTGMFHITIKHDYWRCHDCFLANKVKTQINLFEDV